MINETTLQLEFPNKETVDYINLVCRRKNINLVDYIIENFEWDDMPYCFNSQVKKITSYVCAGCDYMDRCPDADKSIEQDSDLK